MGVANIKEIENLEQPQDSWEKPVCEVDDDSKQIQTIGERWVKGWLVHERAICGELVADGLVMLVQVTGYSCVSPAIDMHLCKS